MKLLEHDSRFDIQRPTARLPWYPLGCTLDDLIIGGAWHAFGDGILAGFLKFASFPCQLAQ